MNASKQAPASTTTALGYISDIRLVQPQAEPGKKAKPAFFAARVVMHNGKSVDGKLKYRYVDVTVDKSLGALFEGIQHTDTEALSDVAYEVSVRNLVSTAWQKDGKIGVNDKGMLVGCTLVEDEAE